MIGDIALDTIVLAAFLAFCRIGACFMLIPGFGSVRVPTNIRLFVAVAVTWALLVYLWETIIPVVSNRTEVIGLIIAAEIAVGALIGLVCRFYVLALQFIAAVIAMTTGFGQMAGGMLEEMEPQAAIAAIITLPALLVLFIFEFHHEVIRALISSYDVAPIAALLAPREALVDLTDTLSEAFYIMLRLGSPFIAYGILVNLAAGFINKLAPQIPVYFVSLPFVIAGGLILLYFALPSILSLFTDGFLPTTLGR
jgi:flagellar biosynthesis protein FliR